MRCQRCESDRILEILSKSSDLNAIYYKNKEYSGYVPSGLNIDEGTGDYINILYCLECGQIQGDFPISDDVFYNIVKYLEDED